MSEIAAPDPATRAVSGFDAGRAGFSILINNEVQAVTGKALVLVSTL